ncbi:hypothetical protein TNCV_4565631 [Trichonephila clavipes]|nr:hypothetical protein TNCV_4565631 [Trichonephila clavipes]
MNRPNPFPRPLLCERTASANQIAGKWCDCSFGRQVASGITILLERRQNESVGRRNSRTTFLRSDWPWPFARREVGVETEWVDPKINDPSKGDLEF